MNRWLILAYGVLSYIVFLGVVSYAILFMGDLWIARTLDSPPRNSLLVAIFVNVGLLTLFAVQHSGMARQGFKRWLTRFIPESVERSTYVLVTNLVMILVFAFWEPMGGLIWSVENTTWNTLIYCVYFLGWSIVFFSTFVISHVDLFGLRHVWLQFIGKPYTHHRFRVPVPYNVVRHPLYVGWLVVFWAAPTMTLAHLLFAASTTVYILVAIQLEERDLVKSFGKTYVEYQRNVPMLIPGLPKLPWLATQSSEGL